jgi:hypothetical protein
MEAIAVEKVMDRRKVADAIHGSIDAGLKLLVKDKIEKEDMLRVHVMRALATNINAGVAMIQQETSQARLTLLQERMKQLGYPTAPKAIGEATSG